MSEARPLVFVSYSREPAEEAEFARWLVGRLREAGFEVWLDEEQIPAGADFEAYIRKAIPAADHALMLITRRWLQRPYTRLELNLFANLAGPKRRIVAVKRERVPELDLAPQLQQLNVIEWLPEEASPDARFWLVYCGLADMPQGPRTQWAERGRRLLSKPSGRAVTPEPAQGQGTEVPLSITRPVQLHASPQGALLAADDDQCYLVAPDGLVRGPIMELRGWSGAANASDGALVVCCYTPMVALLRGGEQEFRSVGQAPVLCLAESRYGVLVGDADGHVILIPPFGPSPEPATHESPVVDLRAYPGGVLALGLGGTLGRLSWAGPWGKLEPVPLPSALEPPVALFSMGTQEQVGIIAVNRLAVFEATGSALRVGTHAFPSGLRDACYLERGPARFAALTDAGELSLVEADLNTARPVVLPSAGREVAGIAPLPAGGLLAWTAEGALFSINRERAVRKLLGENVVLACAATDDSGRALAVCWTQEKGAQVRLLAGEGGR
jgi:hypothetical protein